MTKQKYDLKDLIKESNFYYVNSNIIPENFPVPDVVETQNWKLLRFDTSFTSQEALDKCKKEGLRPANIYELLLWKKEHGSNLKPYEWCIAFGSQWIDSGGDHRVPSVSAGVDGDFEFGLGDFERPWGDGNCLLCFCDSTLTPSSLESQSSSILKPFVPHAPKIEKIYCDCDECENFYKEWIAHKK